MADDEASRDSDVGTTIPMEVADLDDFADLPVFPDREEFVKTQEMDSLSRRTATDPVQPALEVTQVYDVPADLLERAMRSGEFAARGTQDEEDDTWREFVGVVDPRGRIVLPSRVQAELRGKKLRVKYKVDGE